MTVIGSGVEVRAAITRAKCKTALGLSDRRYSNEC